jgi:hypothetical protein
MRMSDYASTKYIGLKDVADGPLRGIIAEIGMGDYDKPIATLTDGSKVGLNKTIVRTMIEAWGDGDGTNWVGKEIEIYADEITVKGKVEPCMKVRVISPAVKAPAPATRPTAKPAANGDMDDQIPF